MSLLGNRRTDLRCTGCGYGIVADGATPPCPMCGGSTWDPLPWRPFTQQLDEMLHSRVEDERDSQIPTRRV